MTNKNQLIRKIIIVCLGLVLLTIAVLLIYKLTGISSIKPEDIQDYVRSLGFFGPLVFIFICFLQVTIVPIPSNIVILAGSLLFGPWLSFFYAFIGIMTGSVLAFYLGRKIGRPFINWIAGDKQKVDGYLKRLQGKEKVLLFFMFLFPLFPDDLLCSVAGILPITWRQFLIMQVITRIPAIAGTIAIFSGEFIPYTGWGLVVIIILAVLILIAFVISMKYSKQINDKIDQWAIKKAHKKNIDQDLEHK